MLLEFRVSNYRSIRDEQCLSLIPVAKDATLYRENTYATGSKLIPEVLKGCATYGANASGKSNLLNAMLFMQAMVRESAMQVQAGQTLNVKGFAFDDAHPSAPSSFELTVLVDGVRYQYGFALTAERVWEEWLLVYKSAKAQEWFSRSWNEKKSEYEYGSFSAYFTGPKDLWKRTTRDNGLFLSTAIQQNSEQLRPLRDWIVAQWLIIPSQVQLGIDLTLKAVSNNPTKQSVLDFLKSADIGIVDITIEKQQAKQTTFKIDGATSKASLSNPVDAEVLIPFFNHVVTGKSVTFGLQDESQGTQRLFAFAGIILFVLERGMTLAVDEIESSMHPLLVRHILGLFFSPETNPHGAQIVFTTHSTNLLDNTLLRRDQIWFTEKSNDQATMLVPLSDFSPRKTEAFEKGYLEGRYGAIPTLSEFRMPADVPDARK